MAELNESKTGVQASCQIAHCTTILGEVPLMFHAYTPEDLKQMDEVLNTIAQVYKFCVLSTKLIYVF